MGMWRNDWTRRLQPWGAVCKLSIFTWCKKTFPQVLVHLVEGVVEGVVEGGVEGVVEVEGKSEYDW